MAKESSSSGGGRLNGNAYAYDEAPHSMQSSQQPSMGFKQNDEKSPYATAQGQSAYPAGLAAGGAVPQMTGMVPPQGSPGGKPVAPTSLAAGKSEQEELLNMQNMQHSTEQEYAAQAKQAQQQMIDQDIAHTKQMWAKWSTQKNADEADLRMKKQQRLQQIQAAETARQQQEMAQWQAKRAQDAMPPPASPMA